MAFERSLQHLTGKHILNSHSAEELAQLAKDYPYFAPAQFLLTAQLKNTGDDFAYTTQLQKASLYSSNPFWLQYQLANITNEETAGTDIATTSFHSPIEIPTLETAIAISQYNEEEHKVEHIREEEQVTKVEEYTPIVFEPYPVMPEADAPAIEAAVIPATEETFEYASILTTVEEEETVTAAPEYTAPVENEPIVFEPYPYMPEPDALATETSAMHTVAEEPETEAAALPTEEPYTFFFAEKEQEENAEDNNVVFLSEQYSHAYDDEESEEEPSFPQTEEENTLATQKISSILNNQLADFHKPVEEDAKFTFEAEPSHLVDYFASQGIKIDLTTEPQDKLTSHLRSFTSWLKKMKRPEVQQDLNTDPRLENAVQDIARTSIESREVVTETMADVFIKQGQIDKAIQLYIKLSFLDPEKTAYFANKIQQLKGI